MITTAEIARRTEGDRLPLLTLDEFFDDNTAEDSLAPNQWGYGRPPLAEILRRLREAEQTPDVAWVRVGLHWDTEVDEEDGDVCAESILIATTAPASELEARLETESLQSDGIIESDAASLEDYCGIPAVSGHERIVFLVWD
ncbi:hypothetical protein ACFVTX_01275 [Agromyces sp. NPDC058136]|uniref:hypothetical protein n=1 Tax=Agromyces sp. NPDC058136 TaxID=3346354 RepID=UPI0036DAF856